MSREMVVKWLTSSEAQVLSVCDVCQFVKVFHDCGRLRRQDCGKIAESKNAIKIGTPPQNSFCEARGGARISAIYIRPHFLASFLKSIGSR